MNKNKIPKGMYCYDDNGYCPYWSEDKSLPEQENGYCAYLHKSDHDYFIEYGRMCTLIWDMCKACEVNQQPHG